MSLVTTGVTGLIAAQMGIQTTGHNIANASTPGFNRQVIVQTTSNPMFSSAGFIGQGTNVATVRRMYDDFQNQQVLNSETAAAQLGAYSTEIGKIDNMLADPNAGLSPAMQAFFTALEASSSNPSSIPARQALLSSAQGLVARFQSVNQRFDDIRSGINQQIAAESGTINSYVQQLKDINQRIIVAQAAGSAQPANDLLDQRNQLVADLNKEIRVTTHAESDGTTSVFFGSGQPLLVGSSSFQLHAAPAEDDLTRIEVTLQDVNGSFTHIPEALVNGGKLGGLLQFRSETLDSAQNSLGRIATVFAATFNSQHKLGQDLTGVLGKDFFNVSPSGQMILGNTSNTGTAKVALTFDNYADLTSSDYRLSMTAANTVGLMKLSDGVTWSGSGNTQGEAMASLMAQVNTSQSQGFNLTLSGLGSMSIGDTFLIRPTRYGARDISMAVTDARNIALAAPISTMASVSNSGTASISAGAVDNTAAALAAPFSISYDATVSPGFPAGGLVGFPVGAKIQVNGKFYSVSSPTMRIPFDPTGTTISLNGVAANITGAPVDGDSFTITPPLFSTLFGVPNSVANAALGSVSPSLPLTVVAGANDQFNIDVDGNGSVPVTIAPGVYATPMALAAQLQTSITAALNLQGLGATATVSLAQNNQIQITSNLAAGAGSVVLSAFTPPPNSGLTALFGVPVSTPGTAGPTPGDATGSVPPTTSLFAGINDKFRISVDGGNPVVVTVPAGNYATAAALATQLQTSLNAAVPLPAGVTVAVVGGNLAITSNTTGVSSSVTLSNANQGTGVLAAATVTSFSSLPVVPITLKYQQANTATALPARLTGLPVGSVVTVTPVDGGAPTSYTIYQPTDYIPYSSQANIAFNGISFSISGAPNDGDTFLVGSNPTGVSDNRNAILLGQLQTKNTLEGGTATYGGAYSQLVNQIGTKANEVSVASTAQETLAKQGQDAIQSMAGVNLDEEAANLIRYQQAYQASAKMIDVASKLFDEVLALSR
ncbi:MAG: flagellar hook-associated protein FlgK [Sterolibacterium sp.]